MPYLLPPRALAIKVPWPSVHDISITQVIIRLKVRQVDNTIPAVGIVELILRVLDTAVNNINVHAFSSLVYIVICVI